MAENQDPAPGQPTPPPQRQPGMQPAKPATDQTPASSGRSLIWPAITAGSLLITATVLGVAFWPKNVTLPDNLVGKNRAEAEKQDAGPDDPRAATRHRKPKGKPGHCQAPHRG